MSGPPVRPPALVRLGIPAAAGAAAFLFFFRPITDDDVWLHFAAGRWILDHARIPDVDEFSCTAAGAAYVDHEWLAQAAFELVRRAFGVGGFRAFLALAPAVAYALFARTALRLRARPVAVLAAVALSLALQWHLARLRPHLWTLLFTAILTDGYLARPRPPGVKGWIGFAALILTWGNSHAAAVIAPALLGAGCAGAWLARDAVRAKGLALLTAGAAALLLVNPYGAGVYIYAFDTQALAEWIPEWKPLASLAADPLQLAQQSHASDFRPQILAVGALAAVCVPLAVWVLWTARRQGLTALPEGCDAALAAVAAPLACLPFTANRHDLFLPVPVFFAAATLSSLREHAPKLRSAAVAAGWLAVLVAAAMLVKDTLYRAQRYAEAGLGMFSDVFTPHSPAGAAAFVKAARLEGCCVSRLAWGGYLLYETWPAVRVAFDGRITTYGETIYLDMVDFNRGRRCAEVAAKYGFDFAVVQPYLFGYGKPREDPRFEAPNLTGEWIEVYRDADLIREGSAVVALRRASPLFERNLARVKALRRQ